MKILLLISILFISCNKKESIKTSPSITCKLVIDIGGCNESALCGVLFNDKTTDKAYYPVKNTKMCKVEGSNYLTSHYRHEQEAYVLFNDLTGKKHLKEE